MSGQSEPSFEDALGQARALLARNATLETYASLALHLGLKGRGRIRFLAQELEVTIEKDAAVDIPLRAALVISRGGSGLPARGFFDKARELGLYDPVKPGTDARQFHQMQLDGLMGGAR